MASTSALARRFSSSTRVLFSFMLSLSSATCSSACTSRAICFFSLITSESASWSSPPPLPPAAVVADLVAVAASDSSRRRMYSFSICLACFFRTSALVAIDALCTVRSVRRRRTPTSRRQKPAMSAPCCETRSFSMSWETMSLFPSLLVMLCSMRAPSFWISSTHDPHSTKRKNEAVLMMYMPAPTLKRRQVEIAGARTAATGERAERVKMISAMSMRYRGAVMSVMASNS
mmetsp:Transcript_64871/g.204901  ORF Transcript_64871/g.204901 Transcript_64871/m.204901 type:complete len:231 (-) Transcript_64871:132-824(-)